MTLNETKALKDAVVTLKIIRDRLTTAPGSKAAGGAMWPEGGPLWRRCDRAIKSIERILDPRSAA